MILILTIDTKSEKNWEYLKCSQENVKDFLLKEIKQFDFNLRRFVETSIIKAAIEDNSENSQDNMSIKIQLTLYADKTWSEKAGGHIKTVIHFHTNKICRFLEEQLYIEKVTCEWRGDNTSNCKHCMFYKNNKVDDIFAYKKEKNSTIEDCYFSFKDTAREKDFALLKSENRCRNFEPCKSYIESVGSVDNFNNFKKLLEKSFDETPDIEELLSRWSTLKEEYISLLKDTTKNDLYNETKEEIEKIGNILLNEHNFYINKEIGILFNKYKGTFKGMEEFKELVKKSFEDSEVIRLSILYIELIDKSLKLSANDSISHLRPLKELAEIENILESKYRIYIDNQTCNFLQNALPI